MNIMCNIRLSLSEVAFKSKPTGSEIGKISTGIAKNKITLNNQNALIVIADSIGRCGHTFCPATFTDGERKQDSFEQMQLLALDFDGGISLQKVLDRAEECNLPVLFAYETFSSVNLDRFRIVFLNDMPITEKRLAKITLNALLAIFPEADPACSDIAKMFFGGKRLLFLSDSSSKVNTESLLRNMAFYLNKEKGDNHYKKYIADFAKDNGIRLNKKGLLDVTIIDCLPEYQGASSNGKISPIAIILPYIIRDGEILPNLYYCINLNDNCTSYSAERKHYKNHAEYRSSAIKDFVGNCALFEEFITGLKKLNHYELFGIATNIIRIETGINVFKETLSRNPDYYDAKKQNRWDFYLKYIRDNDYTMQSCNNFCPYKDICLHGTNILSTVKQKKKTMEKLNCSGEEYYSIEEAQEDLKQNICKAVESKEKKFYIVKAQTAMGKSEAFLELMKTTDKKFLVAVPTNKLKNELYDRAVKKGIKAVKSPSLHEIEDKMPPRVWGRITHLYKTGQYYKVYPYIRETLQNEKIECLDEYLIQKKEFDNYDGHCITTHRKLLNMTEGGLKKFDVVIIDEDIIKESILPNQCEIAISALEKIRGYASKNSACSELADKINEVLKAIEAKAPIKVPGFKWDAKNRIKSGKEEFDSMLSLADIPSFCLAESFMYRDASTEWNHSEDSIVFLMPYRFYDRKYIMVSATASKDICECVFGREKVDFYECKKARYKGVLKQYHARSMSRINIGMNPEIYDSIKNRSKFNHMITFKKFKTGEYYFGNAVGCDKLKGENIDVVGTPYHADFLYRLLPFALGIDVDMDAKMKTCLVKHNGYQFYFTTFGEEHKILRNFHLWMIESELEQAVGRARLLRCDCTVNLYSNFPIKQAVMINSEEPSLQVPLDGNNETPCGKR